jgi:hypothetical protein
LLIGSIIESHNRDKVAKLKQPGRSLDETIAAKPTAAFDAKWGQFVVTTPSSPDCLPGRLTPFALLLKRRRLRPFAGKDGRL